MKVYLIQVANGQTLGVMTDPVLAERVAEKLKANAGTDLHDLVIVPLSADIMAHGLLDDADGRSLQDRLLSRCYSWLLLMAKSMTDDPDSVHMSVKLMDHASGQTSTVDLALSDLLNDMRAAVPNLQEDAF